MEKKGSLGRLVKLIVILLLLLGIGWVAGCGGQSATKPDGENARAQGETGQENVRGEEPETAKDKIYKDLQTGKITEEKAVILGLQAVFAPEDLPEEYRAAAPAEEKPSINAELQWIADNLEKMEPVTREKLEPFILPPQDPKSFFYPGKDSRDHVSKLSFFLAGVAEAANDDAANWKTVFYNVPDGSGKFVAIQYYEAPGSSTMEKEAKKQKALLVKEAIAGAWPKYKELLKVEPDKPFNVYITDLRKDKSWGLAWWNDNAKRCEMSVHDKLEGKELQSTTVHELFHCFQLYIPHRFSFGAPDKMWLFEATAAWSEHFVYPRFNVEHSWLQYFFRSLYYSRIKYNGYHEYASYPLFFFASDFLNDKDYVRRVLVASKTKDAAAAVMESMDRFADRYAKFAVYNWNTDPFLLYSDPPAFPAIGAYGASVGNVSITEPDVDIFRDKLHPGAMSYWHLKFNPDTEKINKVIFQLGIENPSPYVKRQALVKTGDAWVLEDWNDIKERIFCREKPGQKISEVVVILSNADFKNTMQVDFRVDTTGKCPHTITGYTRITERHTGENLYSEIVFHTQDEIEYDLVQKAYVLKSTVVNYSINETIKGQMVIGMERVTKGTGSLAENYIAGEQPIKILEKENETILILEPETKRKDWVTYNETFAVEFAGTEKETRQDSPRGFWPKNIALNKEEISPGRIKGSRTMQTASGFGTTGELVIEFEYELK